MWSHHKQLESSVLDGVYYFEEDAEDNSVYKSVLLSYPDALDRIFNPSPELIIYAATLNPKYIDKVLEIFPQHAPNLFNDYIDVFLPVLTYDIIKTISSTLTALSIRKIYENFGPIAMIHFQEIPDDIQWKIIQTDPELIWVIQAPLAQIIDTVNAAKVQSVWSIPECYYSPKFSFKESFKDTGFDYDEFCRLIVTRNALVSSNMIMGHIFGEINGSLIYIVVKDSRVVNDILRAGYRVVHMPDHFIKHFYTECTVFLEHRINNSYVGVIVTANPLSYIMNGCKYNVYRHAFDGVGLWTWKKFEGEEIDYREPAPLSFNMMKLMKYCSDVSYANKSADSFLEPYPFYNMDEIIELKKLVLGQLSQRSLEYLKN